MNPETTNQAKTRIEVLGTHDFGGLCDNILAFLMIEKLIAVCRITEALDELLALRDHIKNSHDLKSRLYLLGRVESRILTLDAHG